jgi:ABC-type transporter Mla MlaB component
VLELNNQNGNLTIAGQLLIRHLDSFKESLWEFLSTSSPIKVDVSQIKEVDLAGLQLLLAFLKTRKEVGGASITGLSKAFDRALKLTGLEKHYAKFIA